METVFHPLFTYTTPASDFQDSMLALQFGRTHVAYAIKNRSQAKLLALCYARIGVWDNSTFEALKLSLQPFLHPQQQVEIAYAFADLSVLPAANYEEKKLQALHQSLYPFAGPAVFKTETMAEWQLYLGYPVPITLYRGCESLFPGARARHSFKLSLNVGEQSGTQGKFLIDIGIAEFSVVLLKNNRLQFFQTFPYASPADVLYYLLSVCEAQLVSPAEVELVLTGLLEKDSALYRELWQYFTHITLRESLIEATDFPYPLHYFSTLNDLLLCAS